MAQNVRHLYYASYVTAYIRCHTKIRRFMYISRKSTRCSGRSIKNFTLYRFVCILTVLSEYNILFGFYHALLGPCHSVFNLRSTLQRVQTRYRINPIEYLDTLQQAPDIKVERVRLRTRPKERRAQIKREMSILLNLVCCVPWGTHQNVNIVVSLSVY